MKKILTGFLCLVLLAGLLGCGKTTVPESNQGELAGDYPVKITDILGREVVIEKRPEKVISLAPAPTEILFAIGAGDQVIGVSEYCDYPEEALSKPKMGDFMNPNLELIVEQEPDVIFVAAGVQEDFINRLTELGSKVIVLDAENIEQVLKNISIAGQVTGHRQEAEELVAELEARIDEVKHKAASSSQMPTVFFEVWDDPLMTAGPNSFINDLINLAGGKNIADDLPKRFAEFSQELLFERNPDIYMINNYAHTPEEVMARPGFNMLKAVQNGQVYAIEDDLVTLPGPRIVDGLEQMAKLIHPELFSE